MEKSEWKFDSNHSIIERSNENINNNSDQVPNQPAAEGDVGLKSVIPDDMVLAQLTLNIQLDLNQNHPLLQDHQAQNKFLIDSLIGKLSSLNTPFLGSAQNQNLSTQLSAGDSSNQILAPQDTILTAKTNPTFATGIKRQISSQKINKKKFTQENFENDDYKDDAVIDSSSQKSSVRMKTNLNTRHIIRDDSSSVINSRRKSHNNDESQDNDNFASNEASNDSKRKVLSRPQTSGTNSKTTNDDSLLFQTNNHRNILRKNQGENEFINESGSDAKNSRTQTSGRNESTVDMTNRGGTRPPYQSSYKYHENDDDDDGDDDDDDEDDGDNDDHSKYVKDRKNQRTANFGAIRQVIHKYPTPTISESDNFASNETSNDNINRVNFSKGLSSGTNSKVTDESSSFGNISLTRKKLNDQERESNLTNDDNGSCKINSPNQHPILKDFKSIIPSNRRVSENSKFNNTKHINDFESEPISYNHKHFGRLPKDDSTETMNEGDHIRNSRLNSELDHKRELQVNTRKHMDSYKCNDVKREKGFDGKPLNVKFGLHKVFDDPNLHETIEMEKDESLWYRQTKHKNNGKKHNLSVGVIREENNKNSNTEILVRCSELGSASETGSQLSEQSIMKIHNQKQTVDATLILPKEQGKGELKFSALDNPALEITFGATRAQTQKGIRR